MGRVKEALAPEFNTPEELMAHYDAVRMRVRGLQPRPQVLVRRPKAQVHVLPSEVIKRPPPDPDLKRIIYTHPIGPQIRGVERDWLFIQTGKSGRAIVEEVCRKHNLPVHVVRGKGRFAELNKARVEIYRRLWHETGLSASAIGRLCGRDHSTILHHFKGQERPKVKS